MDKLEHALVRLVKAALEEDVGAGDITSLACLEPNPITARIVAKSAGVLSGMRAVEAVFKTVDAAVELNMLKQDGDSFQPGDTIVTIKGYNHPVLVAERTALNFLAHLSGVASLTARFVEKITGHPCKILDTRKTTPGWRLLEKEAVVHGGGANHRLGLYDMVLIKDNHIATVGSVGEAVRRAREYLRSEDFRRQFGVSPETVEIEVEVTNREELTEAIQAGASRLLLDNQTPESLRELVTLARKLRKEVLLEASGNVSLENVAEIAATGVDFISIGALTHSAPASDFSLRVE